MKELAAMEGKETAADAAGRLSNSGGAASSLQDHSDGVDMFYFDEAGFHLSVYNQHSNSRICKSSRICKRPY